MAIFWILTLFNFEIRLGEVNAQINLGEFKAGIHFGEVEIHLHLWGFFDTILSHFNFFILSLQATVVIFCALGSFQSVYGVVINFTTKPFVIFLLPIAPVILKLESLVFIFF